MISPSGHDLYPPSQIPHLDRRLITADSLNLRPEFHAFCFPRFFFYAESFITFISPLFPSHRTTHASTTWTLYVRPTSFGTTMDWCWRGFWKDERLNVNANVQGVLYEAAAKTPSSSHRLLAPRRCKFSVSGRNGQFRKFCAPSGRESDRFLFYPSRRLFHCFVMRSRPYALDSHFFSHLFSELRRVANFSPLSPSHDLVFFFLALQVRIRRQLGLVRCSLSPFFLTGVVTLLIISVFNATTVLCPCTA